MKLTEAMLSEALTPEQRSELDGLLATLRQRELPDPFLGRGGGPCCQPYEVFGYQFCTCWEEIHEPGQRTPVPGPIEDREGMCSTCAFRPGSPELRDDATAEADRAILFMCVADERREFFCHDGMRQIVAMRHPVTGLTVEVVPKNGVSPYDPPKVGAIAYRMDGRPGLRCGGLVAARKSRTWDPWRAGM